MVCSKWRRLIKSDVTDSVNSEGAWYQLTNGGSYVAPASATVAV